MDQDLAADSPVTATPHLDAFLDRVQHRTATIGIIGLGYVGLPLALAAAGAGFNVVGFDIDPEKIAALREGRSYIHRIDGAAIADLAARGYFRATADVADLSASDAILICVPTPLGRHRDPDLSYVTGTAAAIAPHLRAGQLVVLESTTYPGTTREVLKPILEAHGLGCGRDLFLAYSPEREDPGNSEFRTATIPKVVGGETEAALRMACALYAAIVVEVIPVSSLEAAEAVKLTENIFRSVNIALVNELKVVYGAMGLDVWEVIEAAKTKPFGFMPFYPGPGLGGHCIPIDPFYLAWKAREYEVATRFIELAGEVNSEMPHYVVERLARALDERSGRGLNGAKILLVGLAYKRNVDDLRESPALRLLELVEARGAEVAYHDPLIPVVPQTRDYPAFAGRTSAPLDPAALARFDAVLIATDHDDVEYGAIAAGARLIVDTRNVLARLGFAGPTIVKA